MCIQAGHASTLCRRAIYAAIGSDDFTIFGDARDNGRRFKPWRFFPERAARDKMCRAVEMIRELGLTPIDFGLVTRRPWPYDQTHYTFSITVKEAL